MPPKILNFNEALQQDRFESQMQVYADWKDKLLQTIKDYQEWLKDNDVSSPEIELRLNDAVKALDNDQLNVAFVAEFSRGKTELINAIFFANYGRRLFPSEAGRTTMCPTELFYDAKSNEPYIKLLPIETRLNDLSLSDLKMDDSYWKKIPVDINDADKMAASFKEVIKTKQVTREQAEKLGLYIDDGSTSSDKNSAEKTPDKDAPTSVPMWRHAIISFPHPLLKKGLVILDTPGLNALGNEPELTLSMLPSAQAIIFVLSADTGVTRSDLDIWQEHIKDTRDQQKSGLIAVLNKIDVLWDEMKTPEEVNASIEAQCQASAKMLGLKPEDVYPVSAQKALLAKTRQDPELLKRSNLLALESLLANEIIPTKQHVIWDSLVSGIDQALKNSAAPIQSELKDTNEQLDELNSSSGKNTSVINHLISKAKVDKANYYESVKNFQISRRKLLMQANHISSTIGLDAIDELIQNTREDMSGSWTTTGMKNGMTIFFDNIRDALQIAIRHAEQTHELANIIYNKFREDHDLQVELPPTLNTKPYSEQLDHLYLKAEEFRNSTKTTVSEQSYVVKSFFISLVSHARTTFISLNEETEKWLKEIVNPLVIQIQQKRERINKHMQTLSNIKESKNLLSEEIAALNKQKEDLDKRLMTLKLMRGKLSGCMPPDQSKAEKKAPEKQPVAEESTPSVAQ